MSLSKKHYEQLAKILGVNNASNELINDISTFCEIDNRSFKPDFFIDRIKEVKSVEINALKNLSNEDITALSTGYDIDGVAVNITRDPEFFLNK
jgi:hypothetical protein